MPQQQDGDGGAAASRDARADAEAAAERARADGHREGLAAGLRAGGVGAGFAVALELGLGRWWPAFARVPVSARMFALSSLVIVPFVIVSEQASLEQRRVVLEALDAESRRRERREAEERRLAARAR